MTHHVKTIEEGRCCDYPDCPDPAPYELGTSAYCKKHHDKRLQEMEEWQKAYIPKREPKRNRKA